MKKERTKINRTTICRMKKRMQILHMVSNRMMILMKMRKIMELKPTKEMPKLRL